MRPLLPRAVVYAFLALCLACGRAGALAGPAAPSPSDSTSPPLELWQPPSDPAAWSTTLGRSLALHAAAHVSQHSSYYYPETPSEVLGLVGPGLRGHAEGQGKGKEDVGRAWSKSELVFPSPKLTLSGEGTLTSSRGVPLLPPSLSPFSPTHTRAERLAAARARVFAALSHAYGAYTRRALPADEVKPLSGGPARNLIELGGPGSRMGARDAYPGLAMTLVDSLSTLAVVGRWAEMLRGARWLGRWMGTGKGRGWDPRLGESGRDGATGEEADDFDTAPTVDLAGALKKWATGGHGSGGGVRGVRQRRGRARAYVATDPPPVLADDVADDVADPSDQSTPPLNGHEPPSTEIARAAVAAAAAHEAARRQGLAFAPPGMGSTDVDARVNTFEAVIRLLGGLLSAHESLALRQQKAIAEAALRHACHGSKGGAQQGVKYDGALLRLGVELGHRLLRAFDSDPPLYGTSGSAFAGGGAFARGGAFAGGGVRNATAAGMAAQQRYVLDLLAAVDAADASAAAEGGACTRCGATCTAPWPVAKAVAAAFAPAPRPFSPLAGSGSVLASGLRLMGTGTGAGRHLSVGSSPAPAAPSPRAGSRGGTPLTRPPPVPVGWLPSAWVSLRHGLLPSETPDTCLAGAGTLLLEFAALAGAAHELAPLEAADGALRQLLALRSKRGLLGNGLDRRRAQWAGGSSLAGVGAGTDSFYEYLLKGYVLLGDERYLGMFESAYVPTQRDLAKGPWYVEADPSTGHTVHSQFNSLQAFFPGMQVLYGDVAPALASAAAFFSVWQRYDSLPERYLLDARQPHGGEKYYPLRPELIESLYHLRAATGAAGLIGAGERIIDSLEGVMRGPFGYAALKDAARGEKEDHMPSYFLSETVKYLFLLFDEGNAAGGLEWVFTTEGHPLPVKASWHGMAHNHTKTRPLAAGSTPPSTGVGSGAGLTPLVQSALPFASSRPLWGWEGPPSAADKARAAHVQCPVPSAAAPPTVGMPTLAAVTGTTSSLLGMPLPGSSPGPSLGGMLFWMRDSAKLSQSTVPGVVWTGLEPRMAVEAAYRSLVLKQPAAPSPPPPPLLPSSSSAAPPPAPSPLDEWMSLSLLRALAGPRARAAWAAGYSLAPGGVNKVPADAGGKYYLYAPEAEPTGAEVWGTCPEDDPAAVAHAAAVAAAATASSVSRRTHPTPAGYVSPFPGHQYVGLRVGALHPATAPVHATAEDQKDADDPGAAVGVFDARTGEALHAFGPATPPPQGAARGRKRALAVSAVSGDGRWATRAVGPLLQVMGWEDRDAGWGVPSPRRDMRLLPKKRDMCPLTPFSLAGECAWDEPESSLTPVKDPAEAGQPSVDSDAEAAEAGSDAAATEPSVDSDTAATVGSGAAAATEPSADSDTAATVGSGAAAATEPSADSDAAAAEDMLRALFTALGGKLDGGSDGNGDGQGTSGIHLGLLGNDQDSDGFDLSMLEGGAVSESKLLAALARAMGATELPTLQSLIAAGSEEGEPAPSEGSEALDAAPSSEDTPASSEDTPASSEDTPALQDLAAAELPFLLPQLLSALDDAARALLLAQAAATGASAATTAVSTRMTSPPRLLPLPHAPSLPFASEGSLLLAHPGCPAKLPTVPAAAEGPQSLGARAPARAAAADGVVAAAGSLSAAAAAATAAAAAAGSATGGAPLPLPSAAAAAAADAAAATDSSLLQPAFPSASAWVSGPLLVASPPFACEPLLQTGPTWAGAVVVALRGGCTFARKVSIAAAAGARAVLLVNAPQTPHATAAAAAAAAAAATETEVDAAAVAAAALKAAFLAVPASGAGSKGSAWAAGAWDPISGAGAAFPASGAGPGAQGSGDASTEKRGVADEVEGGVVVAMTGGVEGLKLLQCLSRTTPAPSAPDTLPAQDTTPAQDPVVAAAAAALDAAAAAAAAMASLSLRVTPHARTCALAFLLHGQGKTTEGCPSPREILASAPAAPPRGWLTLTAWPAPSPTAAAAAASAAAAAAPAHKAARSKDEGGALPSVVAVHAGAGIPADAMAAEARTWPALAAYLRGPRAAAEEAAAAVRAAAAAAAPAKTDARLLWAATSGHCSASGCTPTAPPGTGADLSASALITRVAVAHDSALLAPTMKDASVMVKFAKGANVQVTLMA